MLLLDLFAAASMVLPRLLPRVCAGQGVFSIAAAAVFAIAASALYVKTARCYDDSLYEFSKRQAGRAVAAAVALFFIVKFLLSAVFILKMFSEVISRTFLTEMPERLIGALFVLTALYSAGKGIETRGRLCEILCWGVIVPVMAIVVLSAFEIHGDRVFPMMVTSTKEIFSGGFLCAAVFSVPEFLLFAMPYVQQQYGGGHTVSACKDSTCTKSMGIKRMGTESASTENTCISSTGTESTGTESTGSESTGSGGMGTGGGEAVRAVARAVVLAAVCTVLIYVACIGVFSVSGAAAEQWPSVTLMQVVRLPGRFISRQDGLMLAVWTGSMIVLLGGYIFYTDMLTKQLFPKKHFKGTMLLWPVLVYVLFSLIDDYAAFERFYWTVTAYAGLPVSILIAAGLGIRARCTGKGGRDEKGV